MIQTEFKVGDIVRNSSENEPMQIFKIAEMSVHKDGTVFYYSSTGRGFYEEDLELAEDCINEYDRRYKSLSDNYVKLLDDFRTVAKVLAEQDPDYGSWLLCNWSSKLTGHI